MTFFTRPTRKGITKATQKNYIKKIDLSEDSQNGKKLILLRAVQNVQYFLENVLIDVKNQIYGISIAFKCELNAHF